MSATDTKKATAATSETIDEAMRSYEKRREEFVETFDRTSNQTIDLFEKTLGVYQATSVTDIRPSSKRRSATALSSPVVLSPWASVAPQQNTSVGRRSLPKK